MFFENQSQNQKDEYQKFLKIVGSLSNLYSNSKTPYLYYRIAEKLFCNAFSANDLSRSDVSADAKKGNIGIGLKTFLAGNDKSFQKVAEFNSDRALYADLNPAQLVKKITQLRNARIQFTEKNHQITNSIYHCVLREEGKFKIFESSMDKVDIDNIQNIKRKKNTITFNDKVNEYSFSLSKSTLSKRFDSSNKTLILEEFNIDILAEPLADLERCFSQGLNLDVNNRIQKTVYLPLYGNNMEVFEKSGLNQWNARGRLRNANEGYIPIPRIIHNNFPDFFPNRQKPFSLKLPNGTIMNSKVCQDRGKALMSYSNKELGQWILRDVLGLRERELLTYAKLQILGIDSVRIDKISDTEFEINFSKVGSYEVFKGTNF